MFTKNQWLHQHHRLVIEKSIPVERMNITTEDNESIEIKFFDKNQTKEVTSKKLLSSIELWNDYFGQTDQRKLVIYKNNWITASGRINAQYLLGHINTGKKSVVGYWTKDCDHTKYWFIHLEYDITSWISLYDVSGLMKRIRRKLKHLGSVTFTNISHPMRGFHVWIDLNKPVTAREATELIEHHKNDIECSGCILDKYAPNLGKNGMRCPFQGDRLTILSDGNIGKASFDDIKLLQKKGSGLSRLKFANIEVVPKKKTKQLNEIKLSSDTSDIAIPPKVEKQSDVAMRGCWVQNLNNLYKSGIIMAGSNYSSTAFTYCSGFLKLMILRGDTDSEIKQYFKDSIFVRKVFPDWELCNTDIRRCRKQADQSGDAINRIYHRLPHLADAMMQLFDLGKTFNYVSESVEKYVPDSKEIAFIVDVLKSCGICDALKINDSDLSGYASLVLTLLYGTKSYSRSHIAAFLRERRLRSSNGFIANLMAFLEDNDIILRERSYRSGMASQYFAGSAISITKQNNFDICLDHKFKPVELSCISDAIQLEKSELFNDIRTDDIIMFEEKVEEKIKELLAIPDP